MIAMGLICHPKLLIADEPTTALDVTIQAQILELMKKLQKTNQMGIIFITHNLGVVAEICDKVSVMYAGKMVEQGPVDDIFYAPGHPYTRGLLRSMPRVDAESYERLIPICLLYTSRVYVTVRLPLQIPAWKYRWYTAHAESCPPRFLS